MEIYLVIITTALVLTQVIRLVQNSKQLKYLKRKHDIEDDILQIYKNTRDTLWEINDTLFEINNRLNKSD